MNSPAFPDNETIREHGRERHGAIAQQGDDSWTDDPTAGEFVVSALVTAYKPAA